MTLITATELSGASPTQAHLVARRYVSALDLDLPTAAARLLQDLPTQGVPRTHIHVLQSAAASATPKVQVSGAPASNTPNEARHSQPARLPVTAGQLMATLRELLLIPSCAQHVAVHFHPILLHLVAGCLSDAPQTSWTSSKTHDIFVMFSILLGPFEEVYP